MNAGIPKRGLSAAQVLGQLEQARSKDVNWKKGRAFSLVFYPGAQVYEVVKEAYNLFFSENALNPSAFPSLRGFEQDVVQMTGALLNAPRSAAGNMTSGGTESILLAVYTAREWARKHRPDIRKPELLMCTTAHPAFNKAAHYFDVKIVSAPPGPDFRADVSAMRQALNDNTILMVGSAPQYPQGVVDPITELAALAKKRRILFHTDACVGGMMLPFVSKLGYSVPAFDFSVPGVTSMSVDLHKYGYAAKGASVVLYRTRELRRNQFFVETQWPGGIYGSPGILGTRPGGSIAAAWAVMQHLGQEGYLALNRDVMRITKELQRGIASIPKLSVLGQPEGSVFAIGSDQIDIHQVGDEMAARGWHLDKQQNPPSLHCTVNFAHNGVVPEFLRDLGTAVKLAGRMSTARAGAALQVAAASALSKVVPASWLRRAATLTGDATSKRQAAMYGMVGSLKQTGELDEIILDFMDKLFSPSRKG